jgi:hypothetical protein
MIVLVSINISHALRKVLDAYGELLCQVNRREF